MSRNEPVWKGAHTLTQAALKRFREKEKVFQILLSTDEQKRWIEKYRQSLGKTGENLGVRGLGMDMGYQLAVESRWRLGVFERA